MSAPSYLLCTSHGFFFRMRVPKPLQSILKKRELKKAITTTDRKVAIRCAIVYAAKAIEFFDALAEVPMAKLPFINSSKIIIRKSGETTEYVLDPERQRTELQDLLDLGIIKTAD